MTSQTIQPTAGARASQPAAGVQAQAAARLAYIDNIRIFLTALVILHHTMIAYAGSGSWIYNENLQDLATTIVGSAFCSLNQSYFMGLFFLISAYFLPASYNRKGAARFWKDRLVRLGIPLLVYSWVIHPLFVYAFLRNTEGLRIPFWTFYTGQFFQGGVIGQGPLWFVETLLIFGLVYSVWRKLGDARKTAAPVQGTAAGFPSNRAMALFALGMGLVSFTVRLVFPMDWNFTPLNLQFPFFAQYIIMFVVGLIAYRRGWIDNLPDAAGRFWLRVSAGVFVLMLPMVFLGGAFESDLPFKGGWHWQSLAYSLWEAFLCVGLCTGVLYLFRRRFNRQGRAARLLSGSAYAAYVLHMPVITAVMLALRPLQAYPLLKFVLAGLAGLLLTFAAAALVKRLPYADRVL